MASSDRLGCYQVYRGFSCQMVDVEDPVLCVWCHHWASGRGMYKKANWVSHEGTRQCIVFLHGLYFSFCLRLLALSSSPKFQARWTLIHNVIQINTQCFPLPIPTTSLTAVCIRLGCEKYIGERWTKSKTVLSHSVTQANTKLRENEASQYFIVQRKALPSLFM